METVYDWLTIAIFAGLVVLLLQRSTDSETPRDSIWQYLIAGVGCGIVNYLGNEGWTALAILMLLATLAYILLVLKPFTLPRL